MNDTYRLMWLPSICRESYVLVTSRGDSVAVRRYASPRVPPRVDRSQRLLSLEAEARQAGKPVMEELVITVDDVGHWWRRTMVANRGGGLSATPPG